MPNSEGTIFSDTANLVIKNYEYGFYSGMEKKVFSEKMKLNLTLRMDKNKNFNFIFSPAASIVYNLSKDNIFRLSFSAGIRNPTLQDQYLYYNVGNAILLGNLNGFDSLVTIESIKSYFNEVYTDKNKLDYFNVSKIVPEKVKSIEFGGCIPDELPLWIAMIQNKIVPHQEVFHPTFWPMDASKQMRILDLRKEYCGVSIGGNNLSPLTKNNYDLLVSLFANITNMRYKYFAQPKKKWLPERHTY
jgi:hypothetical protein